MLASLYITLRFVHFGSLMVAFGCVLYGAWWAPSTLRRLLMQRFYPLLRHLLLISALSALLMLMVQGGLMGEGWPDVWQPAIWQAVAGTRFGSVWVWQILLAWVTLIVVWLKPHHSARLLLVLLCAQLLLLAGVGHAAMSEGGLGRCSAPIMPCICSASPAGLAGCCRLSTACVCCRGAGGRRQLAP